MRHFAIARNPWYRTCKVAPAHNICNHLSSTAKNNASVSYVEFLCRLNHVPLHKGVCHVLDINFTALLNLICATFLTVNPVQPLRACRMHIHFADSIAFSQHIIMPWNDLWRGLWSIVTSEYLIAHRYIIFASKWLQVLRVGPALHVSPKISFKCLFTCKRLVMILVAGPIASFVRFQKYFWDLFVFGNKN